MRFLAVNPCLKPITSTSISIELLILLFTSYPNNFPTETAFGLSLKDILFVVPSLSPGSLRDKGSIEDVGFIL